MWDIDSSQVLAGLTVRLPVSSSTIKWSYRHISQSVCPWNRKVSQELAEGSPFQPREFIAGKDADTLARDFLALDQETFSAAFKGSPIKRAKLRGLQRNASVVLGNVGTTDDIPRLDAALDHDDLLFREHNEWARGALSPSTPGTEAGD